MTSLPKTQGGEPALRNTILHGDCTRLMRELPEASVDLIVTDPPYIVNYRSRGGSRVANDNSAEWLRPAAEGMYRMLKPGGFCVSFYGWTKADLFIDAWRRAGFRIVGHIVFVKTLCVIHRLSRCPP